MINETIIGYMEDEEHNDQDTCVMIIWWFRNYHNYLFRGVKLMFSSLLVCRAVSLSLSSASLWLSPSVPFSLRPTFPSLSLHIPPTPPLSLPFSSLLFSLALALALALPLPLPLPLSQHGKLGTSNMFVCPVPHITENVSITTYFYKISLNKCSIVLTFVIFLVHFSLWSWA